MKLQNSKHPKARYSHTIIITLHYIIITIVNTIIIIIIITL